jgi:hypothetical protein
MENLKVEDWVMYEGKKRQVAIVNGDGTVRLKSDDPTEKYYDNGTIGCFSQGMFVDKKQTAVEWLENELIRRQGIIDSEPNGTVKNLMYVNLYVDLFQQALKMEKQQIIDARETVPDSLGQFIGEAEQYYQETYKSK